MNIILPDEEKGDFEYFVLSTVYPPIKVAMVKFPSTLSDTFAEELEKNPEAQLIWYVTERSDEVDEAGENPASRYELRGSVYNAPLMPRPQTPEEAELMAQAIFEELESNFRKDGYVYVPKATRDGRHADWYILEPVKEEIFTTRTERGMFEEVAWSPFGNIDEATKQDAKNLERNPLMRNW